jgi:hypothetical protein
MEISMVLSGFGRRKTKPLLWFLVSGFSFMVKLSKSNLKKQSQFLEGRNSVRYCLKGSYGNIPLCGVLKNKANLTERQK